MSLTRDDFDRSFPGEGDYVEFKRGISGRALQEAVTAFSNTDGGVILIGVADDGTTPGLTLNGQHEAELHRIVGGVHDAGRYDIHALAVADTQVAVLAVARRENGFAQTSQGAVLVRRGAMNTALIGPELRAFVAKRSMVRFEATDLGVPVTAADPGLIANVAKGFGWTIDERIADRLAEHGLAVRGRNGKTSLTVAGGLYLLTELPESLGKAHIEMFRYTERSDDYDKRLTFEGPLDKQVVEATDAILAELGTDLVVIGVHRHDLPRLPRPVVREAVANAVAHREYEARGTATRIEMRPDVVRIISPGSLPEPVTVENMRQQQAARNLDVVHVLRRLGLAEDAGRGVDVMQDAMQEHLLDPPRFADTGASVVVELPVRSTVSAQERAWVRELVEHRGDIEPTDSVLLVHAARGVTLTNSRARVVLGVDSVDARSALRRLRDAGFLRQTGERGGTQYRLAGDLHPPAGLRLGPEELIDTVIAIAYEGPVTNGLLRSRTGLDRQEALKVLALMVEQGYLVREGEKRGVTYHLDPEFRESLDIDLDYEMDDD